MIKSRTKNQSLRLKVDVGDIIKLVGSKTFTRKLLKLKILWIPLWTCEPLPTAWELDSIMINSKFEKNFWWFFCEIIEFSFYWVFHRKNASTKEKTSTKGGGDIDNDFLSKIQRLRHQRIFVCKALEHRWKIILFNLYLSLYGNNCLGNKPEGFPAYWLFLNRMVDDGSRMRNFGCCNDFLLIYWNANRHFMVLCYDWNGF